MLLPTSSKTQAPVLSPSFRWPRVRPLKTLLQSPAHRVMRVLHVTRSNWQMSPQQAHAAQSGAERR